MDYGVILTAVLVLLQQETSDQHCVGIASKPISDALKGLVYLDDEQMTDALCRKRNLNSNLRIENPSTVLAEGFRRGNEFLYIVVEEAPDQEVIY
jgi:hypothetical protein